jgi:Flp pilus assembly protein TadD
LTLSSGGRSDWSTYYARGISYERAKQWPKAEADFKKALELFPDQPLVLNYLGYSWVDQGMNVPEAFKMLRRAVELRPTDGYIIDSLGWAYYRLGQYPEAVRELEKAIELKASDPVNNDHLGDAYWRVGRKLEAKFQWNHARDLNPEPEDLERILKKIEHGLTDDPKPATAGSGDSAPEGAKNGG